MSYLVFFYGVFVLLGGIFGHAKAGSTMSLIMGVIFGVLLLIASAAIYVKQKWGAPFALVLVFILDAFFTYRFVTTLKFMPSGILALVSLIVLLVLALKMRSSSIK
jgi:uncharacterized membrane protein (UPF0136 family)